MKHEEMRASREEGITGPQEEMNKKSFLYLKETGSASTQFKILTTSSVGTIIGLECFYGNGSCRFLSISSDLVSQVQLEPFTVTKGPEKGFLSNLRTSKLIVDDERAKIESKVLTLPVYLCSNIHLQYIQFK